MNNAEREELDRKVLAYFKAKGTLCPAEVARHFNKKWETAHNSIQRLVENGLVFYHPEISQNPKCYSIWPDHADSVNQRYFSTSQQSKNGNETGKLTITTLVPSTSEEGFVRGELSQNIAREGFSCHPMTRGEDLSREFVRGHLHGQYFVDIKTVGKMPETFIIPDAEITGGWTSRPMRGNECFYGHIRFPYDKKEFNVHAMADKKGDLKGLSVYVHPRFFYYKGNERTAAIEFRQQVVDVLNVLRAYGWEFGAIYMKGVYSMAINDRALASHVPKNHIETDSDSVLYDSSVGDADGVCTEAEILADHESAEAEVKLMVELPRRIWSMESKIESLNRNMEGMVNLLNTTIPHVQNLTQTVKDLSEVTEFNTTAIFGSPHPIQPNGTPYHARDYDNGDAMYG